jgi:hypothetical protein
MNEYSTRIPTSDKWMIAELMKTTNLIHSDYNILKIEKIKRQRKQIFYLKELLFFQFIEKISTVSDLVQVQYWQTCYTHVF